jgi:hypothetical protein
LCNRSLPFSDQHVLAHLVAARCLLRCSIRDANDFATWKRTAAAKKAFVKQRQALCVTNSTPHNTTSGGNKQNDVVIT